MHKANSLAMAVVILLLAAVPTRAANATKAGAGTDLTGATAGVWSGGSGTNGSPGSGDIAAWNSDSLGAGLTLGTSESWGGISVSGALSDIAITGSGTLTNGASGIDLSVSTVNMAITNSLALGASQTWTVNSAKTLTVLGSISGAGSGLTKAGAGALALTGNNTYTGATTVNGGTLALSGGGALATNSAITINGGTLNMGTQNAINFTGNNNGISFGANGGNLNGTGTNTIVGLNSGAIALQVAANGTAVVNENIIVTNMANYANPALASVGSGASLTINGQIIAPGYTLWLQGGGTLTLNNPSPRFAYMNIWGTGGTLVTTNFSALPGGLMVLGQSPANGPATFIYTGPAATTAFRFYPGDATPAIFNNGSGAVTFNAGSFTSPYGAQSSAAGQTLTLGGASDITISGLIQDGTAVNYLTSLLKTNANTLTLLGNSTYSGGTTINAGTLVGVVGGSCSNSAVTVAAASGNTATLGVSITNTNNQWTCSSLTVNNAGGSAGLSFAFGALTPSKTVAPLNVIGSVAFTNAPVITITGSSLPATTGNGYALLTWGSGSAPSLTGVTLTLPFRVGGSLAIVGNTLYLQSSGSTEPISWTGGAGLWDGSDLTNTIWKDSTSGSTYYVDGDAVVFNNTAGSGGTVTLNTIVSPASVTVTNPTANYTISGSGGIAGSTALTKSGAGTLALSTANNYSGATTVNGGTLALTGSGALATNSAITINGGTLNMGAQNAINFTGNNNGINFGVNGGNLNGTGTNIIVGVGAGAIALQVAANGTAVVNENIVVTNMANYANPALASVGSGASLTVNGEIIAPGYTLWLQGGGTLTLNNPSPSFTYMNIWSTGGTIATTNFSALPGGVMVLGQNPANGPATFSYTGPGASTSLQFFPGGPAPTILNNGSGAVTFSASDFTSPYGAQSNATPQILTLGGSGDITISGVIRDGTAATFLTTLVKTNADILTLAGNNTYSGGTEINAGTLVANNSTALGAGLLTLNGGVLSNSISLTLSNLINLVGVGTVGVLNGNTLTLAGLITNRGALTKTGAGTLRLINANTYGGGTTISAGTLALSGSGAIANSTNLCIAGGAALDVSGLASFTLGAGQTLSNSTSTATINGSLTTGYGVVSLTYALNTPLLTVANGTMNLAAWTSFMINNVGAALPAGSYKIISKGTGGLVAGALPSVTVSGAGVVTNLGTGLQVTNGELFLVVGGSSSVVNVVWTGADAANPTRWNDTQTDTNWFTSGRADAWHYYDGDQVLFNDSNNGQYTVNIATAVSPGSLSVDAAGNYIFNGSGGGITGATGLAKDGVGSLTLNGANSFAGGTIINSGMIVVGNPSALSNSSVTVNNAGGLGFAINAVTLGNLAGFGSVNLTDGNTPVTLTLGGNNSSTTYAGNLGGAGSLIKTGGGVFTLTGNNVIGGSLTVSNGTLTVNGSLSSAALAVCGGILSGSGTVNAPVSVASGGTLSPGIANAGQITINNTLSLGPGSSTVMQVGKGLTNYASTVGGVSTLAYGGTLVVTSVSGTVFVAGDTFQLFGAAQYTGTFNATNLPALGTGLKWSLTGLTKNGSIQVVPFWSVPAVFGDNMVLQRGIPVPIWGTAEPGQTVSVTFGGQNKTATTGSDRKWLISLDSMVANTNSQTLTIMIPGITNIVHTNVVVGDVWLASGQSNMDGANTPVSYVTNSAAEIAAANYPLIRNLKLQGYNAPVGSFTPVWDAALLWSWTPCSPATVSPWGATAYFFARTLFQSNNVPIGILESPCGGTPLQTWTSVAAMDAVPELKAFADQDLANYFQGIQTDLQWVSGSLFNAMISPLIPFGLRGVIWYQGESGGGSSTMQYRVLFPTMIQDWRSRWQQADLPFYFVQLPNYSVATTWPYTREAQLLTLQTATNTGMAVTMEIGDPNNIHPLDKQDVGARLADLALNRNYGFTNVVPSGPIFRTYTIETNQIRLFFDYAEGGLMTGQKNGLAPVQELAGVAPMWFEIAGSNQIYYPATARIDTNNTVVVSSPSVSNPTLARYAWSANPQGTNLYNLAGLPASPFRIPVWTNLLPVSSIQINAGSVQSTCPVSNNVTWWVEFNDALAGPTWAPLALPQTGTGAVQTVTDPINGNGQRFYRWVEMP